MDTNMEDVGRAPAELTSVNLEPTTIPTVDGWIESLMNCKQLAEVDVQRLCEKVCISCFIIAPSLPRSMRKASPRRSIPALLGFYVENTFDGAMTTLVRTLYDPQIG
jgi:hypothetical protein